MTQFQLNTTSREYRYFSEAEAAVIREAYPVGGVKAVREALRAAGYPDRTSDQLRNWCHRNGVKFLGTAAGRPIEQQAQRQDQ